MKDSNTKDDTITEKIQTVRNKGLFVIAVEGTKWRQITEKLVSCS